MQPTTPPFSRPATRRKPFSWLMSAALATIAGGSTAQAADVSMADAPPPPPAQSTPAPPPVPLGVFGDTLPGAGNLVLTLSPQFVHLAHELIGTQGVSPQQIVATTPWLWGPTVPLRVVPIRRFDELQSLTLGYGVTKDFSIVLSTGLFEKHTDLMTFYGASGVIPRGMANPGTESLQDTQLAGIWRVYQELDSPHPAELRHVLPDRQRPQSRDAPADEWNLGDGPWLLWDADRNRNLRRPAWHPLRRLSGSMVLGPLGTGPACRSASIPRDIIGGIIRRRTAGSVTAG